MKSKLQKTEELKSLKDKLPKSKITVFTSFSPSTRSGQAGEKGLSVAQMTELKRALRLLNSEYLVAKKSLMDLALKGLKYDGIDVLGMEGSVGLVLGDNDPYVIAKKLYEFSRKNQALKFFGALLRPSSAKATEGKQGSEGQTQFINLEAFLEMAKMPPREILIGRLVGMLKYPFTSLTVVLSEINKQKGLNS